MPSENSDVIKIDTTGRQTTRPRISKMADRRYHVASISRQFRGPIYIKPHASSSFDHGTEGITAFSNRFGVVVWTGENDTKTISVDANLFENGAKQLRFRLKTDQCGQGLSFLKSVTSGATEQTLSNTIAKLCKLGFTHKRLFCSPAAIFQDTRFQLAVIRINNNFF